MTSYRVLTGTTDDHGDAASPPDTAPAFDPDLEPTSINLRWRPGGADSNIECGTGFFAGWRPTSPAEDLLLIAGSVYCVDKLTARRGTTDGWTRTISLDLPAAEPDLFADSGLASSLGFLSGDLWDLQFRPATQRPLASLVEPLEGMPTAASVDVVSLFSGGLDSLCGVIDLLEEEPNQRVGLVGHYDGGQGTSRQGRICDRLAAHYGSDRVSLYQLWLRPAPASPAQSDATPPVVEQTTRARSLLFIAAALAVASAAGPGVPVVVPENGYIAVNVPLTRARNGSATTRTTHPHFLAGLSAAARHVGVSNCIDNPYRFRTKGEMLTGSANRELVEELAPDTVSCSHPEASRMQQRPQGNCGYCFPCMIRRAAMAAAGIDRSDQYAWDVLTEDTLITETHRQRGADLRAVLNAVYTPRPDIDLLRNAPLPAGSHADHLAVWRRGTAELRSWFDARADGALAVRIRRLR